MKYIVTDGTNILQVHETTGNYTVSYPPLRTVPVNLDDSIWPDIQRHTWNYTYADGEVKLKGT